MRRNLIRTAFLAAALVAAAPPAPLAAQQTTSEREREQRERDEERARERAERDRERAERDREREREHAERDRERAKANAERERVRNQIRGQIRSSDDRDDERGSDSGPQVTRVDTTVALGQGAVVDLSLVSGEIVVTGWTRGEARVKASTERGSINFLHSAQRLSLETRSLRGRSGDTRYELTVPEGTRVLMRSTSGDLKVSGVKGEVEARSVSGDVSVSDATRSVTIETVSGEVIGGRVAGDLHGTSVSGDVALDGITGDVDFTSVSGEIALVNARSRRVHLAAVSGDLAFQGPLDAAGRYEFGTHSGNVELTLPADASAVVSVQTFSGTMDSQFQLTMQPAPAGTGRNGRRMEFTLGRGGPRVSAETFSGNINLERGASRGSK
jgi:DUF4097 and DUF4098 domain-containing protein YvlB